MAFDIQIRVLGVRVDVGCLGLELENFLSSIFFLDSLVCEDIVFIWEIKWRLHSHKKNKTKAFPCRQMCVFGKA